MLEGRIALHSDVRNERVYFVGERPRRGEWRGGNENGKDKVEEDMGITPEEVLDKLYIGGKHTRVWISQVGEENLAQA